MHYRYSSEEILSDEALEQFRMDLPVIMGFAAWSDDDMALNLGVTRTTFIRLRNTQGSIRPVYYLAICKLIDDYILENGRDCYLQKAIDVLNGSVGAASNRDALYDQYVITRKQTSRRVGKKGFKAALEKLPVVNFTYIGKDEVVWATESNSSSK